jgi:dihydrofolate reductase
MPKVILYIAQSLDGYIATPDGSVSWLDPYNSEAYGYEAFLNTIEIVVMGAHTYEQVLTFGEYPYKNKLTHLYTSRTLPTVPNAKIHCFSEFSSQYYQSLPPTTIIWLVGGSRMIQTFAEANLITSYQIFTMPVILRNGIPLFQHHPKISLTTLNIKQYANGVIESIYSPA